MLIRLVICLGAGIIIGFLLTTFFGSLLSPESRNQVWKGVGLGFGAGFGAVAALITLNKLVGYLDRLASGKA